MNTELNNKEVLNAIFNKLKGYYGDISRRLAFYGPSWWPADEVVEIMVGAILTQNTNWRNVEKALANFNNNLTPHFILEASHEELIAIIRPSGFYNQKADRLKALMQWFSTYNFDVALLAEKQKDEIRNELLAIKGIGNETADSILVYALGKTSFVIDAYTRRIFSRVGIVVPKEYDEFQELLEKTLPMEIAIYDHYHGLIVEHAKRFCTKKPMCEGCPLNNQKATDISLKNNTFVENYYPCGNFSQ